MPLSGNRARILFRASLPSANGTAPRGPRVPTKRKQAGARGPRVPTKRKRAGARGPRVPTKRKQAGARGPRVLTKRKQAGARGPRTPGPAPGPRVLTKHQRDGARGPRRKQAGARGPRVLTKRQQAGARGPRVLTKRQRVCTEPPVGVQRQRVGARGRPRAPAGGRGAASASAESAAGAASTAASGAAAGRAGAGTVIKWDAEKSYRGPPRSGGPCRHAPWGASPGIRSRHPPIFGMVAVRVHRPDATGRAAGAPQHSAAGRGAAAVRGGPLGPAFAPARLRERSRGSVVVVVLHEEELAREGPAAPGMGLMPREGEGARLGKRSWREGGGARLQSGEAKGGLRRDAALAMAEKERGAIRNTSTGRSREYWVYPRESGGPESDVNPEHYLKHTI
eukprot:gene9708-biopygen3355